VPKFVPQPQISQCQSVTFYSSALGDEIPSAPMGFVLSTRYRALPTIFRRFRLRCVWSLVQIRPPRPDSFEGVRFVAAELKRAMFRAAVAVMVGLLLFAAQSVHAENVTLPLPPEDRKMIDAKLGAGVVGEALPCKPIGHVLRHQGPASYLPGGTQRGGAARPRRYYSARPRRPHLVTNGGNHSTTFFVLQGLGEYDFVPPLDRPLHTR